MSSRIDSIEAAPGGPASAGAAPSGVASASTPDSDRLQAFIERYGADQAATMHAATVVLGDRLGLYAALAAHGPCPPEDLAEVTGCHPRLLREWLNAQVASGYTEHDAANSTYWLTPEQAACLADAASPTYLIGGMLAASSNHKDVDTLVRAFTSGGGLGWGGHHPDLYVGTQRLFGPVYRANLVPHWIPALEGMQARLESGARVVDVGCGHGEALIRLAEAYPASRFAGFDNHVASIEAARTAAAEAGVSDRVTFEVATAEDFPGRDIVVEVVDQYGPNREPTTTRPRACGRAPSTPSPPWCALRARSPRAPRRPWAPKRGRRNLSRWLVKPGSPGSGGRPRPRCSWSWKPGPEGGGRDPGRGIRPSHC